MHKIREMQTKLHIKKGDAVIVIAGNYKGREGKVLEVITHKTKRGSSAGWYCGEGSTYSHF